MSRFVFCVATLLAGSIVMGCGSPTSTPENDVPEGVADDLLQAVDGEDDPASWDEGDPVSINRIGSCSGSPGSGSFCSSTCPCEDGEGDCDSDSQCVAGHRCMRNIGAEFGWDPDVDVCMAQCPDIGGGSLDFCSPGCPCELGEGDCDSDGECVAGAVCARGVGASFGYSPDTDVCVSECDDVFNGTFDFCSPSCPCDFGQGDCDNDDDCAGTMVCGQNVGASFGFPADMDVCVDACSDLLNGTFGFCTPSCPCDEGQADCNTALDCAPGLICGHDLGASYGYNPEMDVCVASGIEASFAGRVIDDTGTPVTGAAVSINGQTVLTDTDGAFSVVVDATTRYVINTEMRGFVPGSRVHVGDPISDMVIELQVAQTFDIDPTEAVDVVDNRGTRIELPPGALVGPNGEAPEGPITMEVYTYDVVNEGMVGDMTAVDASGAPVVLQSVGAVSTEFFDEAGNRYQLAPGQTAQISVIVPPEIAFSGFIPLWYFNMETGQWVEEGMGFVENGVATGTVSHFSAWNFDVKFQDPACVRVSVATDLVPENGSLQARIVVLDAFKNSRTVDLPAGLSVFYNLPPNTDIEVYIPASSTSLRYTVNTGAPWGGAGTPPEPYAACNGELIVEGPLPGAMTGYVRLEQRDSGAGTLVEVSNASTLVTTVTVNESSRYNASVDNGTYSLKFFRPGYLALSMDSVQVIGGKVVYQPCVELSAGDANEDGQIDSADLDILLSLIGSPVPADHPADFDGNLMIDGNDLNAVNQNLGLSGVQRFEDGLNGCNNEVPESEPNEDGTPQTGGQTLSGNDFSTANANGPFSRSTVISGAFAPAGDEDVFAVTNTGTSSRQLALETFTKALGVGAECDFSVDTVLTLRDASGAILDQDDDSNAYCSFISYTLAPGETVYVQVTEFGDDREVDGYYLDVRFE